MPQNSTLKNNQDGKFQVVYTLPTINIYGIIHLKYILCVHRLMIINILGFAGHTQSLL